MARLIESEVIVGGSVMRRYVLHVPFDWMDLVARAPLPVVLMFHGGGNTATGPGNATDFANLTRMHRLDERVDLGFRLELDRFITVYCEASTPRVLRSGAGLRRPDGTWSCGFYGEGALMLASDDVAYVRALLDDVDAVMRAGQAAAGRPVAPPIDPERIHAVGYASGACFVYCLLASQPRGPRWWRIASAAVVHGSLGGWAHASDRRDGLPEVSWDPTITRPPPASLLVVTAGEDEHIVAGDGPGPTFMRSPAVVADLEGKGFSPSEARQIAPLLRTQFSSFDAWRSYLGRGVRLHDPLAEIGGRELTPTRVFGGPHHLVRLHDPTGTHRPSWAWQDMCFAMWRFFQDPSLPL